MRMLENCRNPCEFHNNYSAGFNKLTSLVEKCQGTFPDVNHLMNLFRSISPFSAKVPADMLDQFFSLVKEDLLKSESVIVANTGEVKVTWGNILIIAKKI